MSNLEGYIRRYKVTYSTTALILGLGIAIGGVWLASLDGYYTEAKGWLLHIFGCAILHNNNNLAPGFWLFLVGLFVAVVTQYRVTAKRKFDGTQDLGGQALHSRFIYSIAGLFVGLLLTIYGIAFEESGINLCPADLVPHFRDRYSYMFVGDVLVLVGIIVVIATRFRIRIHKGSEIVEQSNRIVPNR